MRLPCIAAFLIIQGLSNPPFNLRLFERRVFGPAVFFSKEHLADRLMSYNVPPSFSSPFSPHAAPKIFSATLHCPGTISGVFMRKRRFDYLATPLRTTCFKVIPLSSSRIYLSGISGCSWRAWRFGDPDGIVGFGLSPFCKFRPSAKPYLPFHDPMFRLQGSCASKGSLPSTPLVFI